MDGSDFPPVRDARGRFVAGNPGRPFGSRNRMSKRVARGLLRDFEGEMPTLLPILRRWFMPQYLQLVARLLPRVNEAGGIDLDDETEIETATVLAAVRAALDRVEAGEATLADLESALLGEGLGEGRHN